MRTDDEMSVQEQETTHVSVGHPSASETIPSDVPVASVEPEDSVPTTPPRRILFKRPPNPLDRVEPSKRTEERERDYDFEPWFVSMNHSTGKKGRLWKDNLRTTRCWLLPEYMATSKSPVRVETHSKARLA